jgi:hypothetical protein
MAAGHDKALCEVKLAQFENDEEAIKAAVKDFVFETCKAEANWNMKNFVADQVELIRQQVGDKKVLLALSGGVDSSVLAALLLKAIGDKLYLVCHEVLHIPVSLSLACVEYKILHCSLDSLFVVLELSELNLAESLVVACSHYRKAGFVYFWKDIDRNSVYYIVRPTVDDDTFYIRKSLELWCGDVVRVNFTVNTQCTDCPGYHCVFVASKVKNDDHILFHISNN